LPRIPRPRFVHFHRGRRGRMQSRHCYPAQASRHALDRPRLRCHHRSALLKTQWTLSGLLGAQSRTWGQGRMTLHFLVVHPGDSYTKGKTAGAVYSAAETQGERFVGTGPDALSNQAVYHRFNSIWEPVANRWVAKSNASGEPFPAKPPAFSIA